MKLMPVGADIAKNIIQIHYVDEDTGEIISKALKRGSFLSYFSNRPPCLIGIEASGGAHHWARQLSILGHQVKLMPGAYVKAFNIRNKNDMADAEAIWRAVQQPGKAVAVKTESQQAMLALHRVRFLLVKSRQMQVNELHGLLAEYGEIMRKGRASLYSSMPGILAHLEERLPAELIETLREQLAETERLEQRIVDVERRIKSLSRNEPGVRAICEIPGVGFLTATTAIAAMGSAGAFHSGREFAAWIGLVPRQTGTGGKVVLKGISKRGDKYLRKLLINGAHSVIQNANEPGSWVTDLLKRRPVNVVSVALANKMARTIWAVLAHGKPYLRTPPETVKLFKIPDI